MQARTTNLTNLKPLRLLMATLVVAVAGSMAHTAMAAPGAGPGGYGGPGGHGGHGMMGGPGGPGGAGMGFGMGHPRQVERMLDSVNASAEQRSQIQQILQAARTDLQAQREAGRALHDQMRALFTQPTVDARAVETLRQQKLAQHDQASKRMSQVMIDVSRVLTVEQRKTLADRMGQRRAWMEQHRAARPASAPGPR